MKRQNELERRGGSGNGDWFVFRTFTERRAPGDGGSASGRAKSASSLLPRETFPFVEDPAAPADAPQTNRRKH